jgi:hypothetical protein
MFAIDDEMLRTSCNPEALPSGTTRFVVKVCVSVICPLRIGVAAAPRSTVRSMAIRFILLFLFLVSGMRSVVEFRSASARPQREIVLGEPTKR